MRGIVLAGGRATRLYPATLATSKHLLPIYNKPMIYYPISVLLLAGIREIMIISTPEDLPSFERLLKDGSQFGVRFIYASQDKPRGIADCFRIGREFLVGHQCCLILGDNIFYGEGLTEVMDDAQHKISTHGGAVVFGYKVKNPSRYGVIEFKGDLDLVASIEEKPASPKSHWAQTGLYFYDAMVCEYSEHLSPSGRGELEITDLNNLYLEMDQLRAVKLGRGFAWLDTGTHSSMLEASLFVRAIEERQGLAVACLEEIAYKLGFIDETQMTTAILDAEGYLREYLRRVLLD